MLAFSEALEKSASLACMLPADLPTCDFIVDILLHLCCMPVCVMIVVSFDVAVLLFM